MEHLSTRDLRVLARIVGKGEAKAYDLIRETGLSVGTIYNTLQRMIASGLVVKENGFYKPTESALRLLYRVSEELLAPIGYKPCKQEPVEAQAARG